MKVNELLDKAFDFIVETAYIAQIKVTILRVITHLRAFREMEKEIMIK